LKGVQANYTIDKCIDGIRGKIPETFKKKEGI
jgi:hypothetical protein